MEHLQNTRRWLDTEGTGVVCLRPPLHAGVTEGVPARVDEAVRGLYVANGTRRGGLGATERFLTDAGASEVIDKSIIPRACYVKSGSRNVEVKVEKKQRDVLLEVAVRDLRDQQSGGRVLVRIHARRELLQLERHLRLQGGFATESSGVRWQVERHEPSARKHHKKHGHFPTRAPHNPQCEHYLHGGESCLAVLVRHAVFHIPREHALGRARVRRAGAERGCHDVVLKGVDDAHYLYV